MAKFLRKRSLVIFCLLLAGFSLSGMERAGGEKTLIRLVQEGDTSPVYRKALELLNAGDTRGAFDAATTALQDAMRLGQEETELSVLNLLSEISLKEGSPGDAIPYAIRAASILEGRKDTSGWKDACVRLAGYYQQEEVYEKMGEYLHMAYSLCPEESFLEKAGLMEQLGQAAMKENLPDSAAVCFRISSRMLRERMSDDTQILIYLSEACNRAGRDSLSLEVNTELFERFAARKEYALMSAVRNNMGYNQSRLKNYEQAVTWYREAEEYALLSGGRHSDLAVLNRNMGVCYQNMDSRKKALSCFRTAADHLEKAGDRAGQSSMENMIALVYFHAGDLYNAGQFSLQAIESATEAGDAEKLSEACLTYSRVLREGNDPIQALEYYEKYLEVRDSVQIEAKLREQQLTGRKYELEKSEKELKLRLKEEEVKELAIQQLTLQLEKEEREKELLKRENDLEQLEKERLLQSFELARQKHEVEQQTRENQILEQENRIKEFRLKQEEQKQKEQEQEIALLEQQKQMDSLELEKQKEARTAMIWTIVMVGLIALLILSGLITTRRKNQLLATQKTEIEEKNTDLEHKNEEISAQRDEIEAQRNLLVDQKERIQEIHSEMTKSIEYAKRIQSSTLPGMEGLTVLFRDHFLLFRPRDIVSGDFYWLANLEDVTVLTVVDCTGHGVPGAFMSILGMSLLKEIVVKEYITHPAVILRKMRKEVISALGQKGAPGEQRDGMDMSLITVHHETGKVEYAGANNSIYLVRKAGFPPPEKYKNTPMEDPSTGDVLYEIPPDKMPIALYDRMDKFTNHEIPVYEDDRLYMFTDGYADQFGSEEGKKFMYKPFKRMILGNASKPMKEQLQIIETTLDSWKGEMEQIDDICVIGLKL